MIGSESEGLIPQIAGQSVSEMPETIIHHVFMMVKSLVYIAEYAICKGWSLIF